MRSASLQSTISLITIGVSLATVVAGAIDSPLVPYLLVLNLGCVFALVAVLVTGRLRQRRIRRLLAEKAPSRYVVSGRQLQIFERRLSMHRGDPQLGDERLVSTVDLDRVAFISWWASSLAPDLRDEFVFLWDRDPHLVMTDVQPEPTDEAARQLGRVSLIDLARESEVRRGLLDILAERRADGVLDANVDIETGKVIAERLPPLADDVEVRRGRIVQKRASRR